jgi:hypothetical protein
LAAAYSATQSASVGDEEGRIKAAIQIYFDVKAQSMVSGRALDPSFVIDRSVNDGRDLYSYELGRLQYSLHCWQSYGLVFTSVSFDLTFDNIRVKGSDAEVELRVSQECAYSDTSQIDVLGDEPHTLRLVRQPSGWKVVADRYADEFTSSYPRGTNFGRLIQSYAAAVQQMRAEEERIEEALLQENRLAADMGVLATYIYPNQYEAAWYGLQHSCADPGCTVEYNPAFHNWAPENADCQNFASQYVWKSFGGQDANVPSHASPMVTSGGTAWWCDASTATLTWINCGEFRSMAINNRNAQAVGVWGLSAARSMVVAGDTLVYAYPGYGHVLVVTYAVDSNGINGLEYSEIYICAHTKNRLNHKIALLYPSEASVRYFKIERFRSS